jgi:hypothetical protein
MTVIPRASNWGEAAANLPLLGLQITISDKDKNDGWLLAQWVSVMLT